MKKFCHECGHSLAENAKFCPECGAKVIPTGTETSTVTPEVTEEKASVDQATTESPEEKQDQANLEKGSPETQENNTVPPVSEQAEDAEVTKKEAETNVEQKQKTVSPTPTNKKQLAKKQQPPKKSSKLKVILISFITIILLATIGGYFYGNYYFSEEKTVDRFQQAIKDKDKERIKDLLQVSGKKKLTNEEIDGLLAFAKEENRTFNTNMKKLASDGKNDMFKLKEAEKFWWIFKQYKLEATGQYLAVDYPFADIVTTINGKAFDADEDGDDYEVFGPLLPGIYTIESVYTGEFVDASFTEEVVLWDVDEDEYLLTVELDVSEVEVKLTDATNAPIQNAILIFSDKEVALESGTSFPLIGPISTKGDVHFKLQVEYPWGTVESEEIVINDSYIEVSPHIADGQLIETVAPVVSEFGESFYEALSLQEIDKVKHVTEEVKTDLASQIKGSTSDERLYTAQLNATVINDEEMYYDGDGIVLIVDYDIDSTYYDAGEKPELKNSKEDVFLTLAFNSGDWVISGIAIANGAMPEGKGMIIEGAKKQYILADDKKSNKDKKKDDTKNDKKNDKKSTASDFKVDPNGKNVVKLFSDKEGIKSTLTWTANGDEVTKQKAETEIPYDFLGVTNEDEAKILPVLIEAKSQYEGIKGAHYQLDFKKDRVIEIIEVDYETVDIKQLENIPGFISEGNLENGISLTKSLELFTNDGYQIIE